MIVVKEVLASDARQCTECESDFPIADVVMRTKGHFFLCDGCLKILFEGILPFSYQKPTMPKLKIGRCKAANDGGLVIENAQRGEARCDEVATSNGYCKRHGGV